MYSPQKYWDLYPPDKVQIPVSPEDDLDDVPKIGQQLAAFRREEFTRIVREDKWKEFVRAYLAAISFADAMIGDLVNSLERSAHARNTIIVFWSDNGWHLGEKQHVHKSTLWHRSTHVPLVIAGPGAKATGRTRTQPVSLLDLYPTLVDLCSLPPRPQLEGVSLSSLLRDPNARHDPVVSTFEPGNHAVCDTRWRYIRYSDSGEELYDRPADPNEWRNLAADPKLDAVKRELARFLPEKSAPPVPDRTAYDFDFTTYSYRRKP